MISIDWEEFKKFKKNTIEEDRLKIVINFLRSYYNISSPRDMFILLIEDDLGQMILEKRDITDAEGLERFIFKS